MPYGARRARGSAYGVPRSQRVLRTQEDLYLSGYSKLGAGGVVSWRGLGASRRIFGTIWRHLRLSRAILELILGSPRRSLNRLERKSAV